MVLFVHHGKVPGSSSSVIGPYQSTYEVYAASMEAAVEVLTHVPANEMGSRRITVNAVAPGPTATPLFSDGRSDEVMKRDAGMNRSVVWASRTTSPASSPSSRDRTAARLTAK